MLRSVFAPRFAVLVSLAGAFTSSACSGDDRDFFGNPGSTGGSGASAGSSAAGAGAGKAGEAATGGSSGKGAGQGGSLGGAGGSGGVPTAGNTSSGGSSGDAGENAGGSPAGGHGGEGTGGAGEGGSPNEAGAANQAGNGGDASGGSNANGGSSGAPPNGGTSGGGTSGGGTSGSGGISGSGGTDPNGGTGGTPIPTCHDDGDCQSEAEYCKKAACAAEVGVCAPRPESCTGADAALAPVCGCDAMTYFSGCVAAREGVNIASSGECSTANAMTCTRTAGGDACMPSRKLARCYRPRSDCTQPSPSTGTCWVLPDECPAEEPADAYYCRGTAGSAGCVGLCAVLEREDSMVREASQCR